jgi:DNA mismatch endonuclease, patch repair protein
MQSNRGRDTAPERELRSVLHRAGLRFRKHYRVHVGDLATRVDIAFPKQRVAVFMDGCFWHCCPQHATAPRANGDFWAKKLQRNVQRDRQVNVALGIAGWTVVRIWEHEPVSAAAARVLAAIRTGHEAA